MKASKPPSAHWRKSTHSGGDKGECVETADLNGQSVSVTARHQRPVISL